MVGTLRGTQFNALIQRKSIGLTGRWRSALSSADRSFSWLLTGVGLGYWLGAELAWGAFGASQNLTFFPSAGVTFAALAVTDRRRWPALAMVVVLVELLVDFRHGLGPELAAGYALANVAEPVVGASVAIGIAGRGALRRLDEWRGMLGFVSGGMVVGPVVAAVIGATVKGFDTPSASWSVAALGFWGGDALGVLVFGAPLLVVSRARWSFLRRRWAEAGVNVVVTAVVSVVVFVVVEMPVAYLVVVPLVWAAFRRDALELALDGFIIATVASVATAQDRGVFASVEGMSGQAQIGLAKLFLATMLLIGWFVLITANERDRIQQIATRGEVEHAALDRLRASVLPQELTTPGVEIVARYLPAQDIFALGGDWYDVVERPDGEIVLVVGDVVGGGLQGGLTMTQLQSGTRSLLTAQHEPAQVLDHMDRFVKSVTGGFAASLACVQLSPTSGRYMVAVAGHPPPVILSPDASCRVLTVAPGPLLGLGKQQIRQSACGTLAPGETIVLYTDGLVERRGEVIDVGIARLVDALQRSRNDLPQWPDDVLRACLDGATHRDDIALLACRLSSEVRPRCG